MAANRTSSNATTSSDNAGDWDQARGERKQNGKPARAEVKECCKEEMAGRKAK